MEPTTPSLEGRVKLHPDSSLERPKTKKELAGRAWGKQTKTINRPSPYFYPSVAQRSPEVAQTSPTPAPRRHPGATQTSPAPAPPRHPGATQTSPTPAPRRHPGATQTSPTPAPRRHPGAMQTSPTPAPRRHPGAMQTSPTPAPRRHPGENYHSSTISSTQRSIANQQSGSSRPRNPTSTHSESPTKEQYSSASDVPNSRPRTQVPKTRAYTTPGKKSSPILLPNSSPDGRVRRVTDSPFKRARPAISPVQDSAVGSGHNSRFTRDARTVHAYQLTGYITGGESQPAMNVQHTPGGGLEPAGNNAQYPPTNDMEAETNFIRSPSYASLFASTDDDSAGSSHSGSVQHPPASSMKADISGLSSFRSRFSTRSRAETSGSEHIRHPPRASNPRSNPAGAIETTSHTTLSSRTEGAARRVSEGMQHAPRITRSNSLLRPSSTSIEPSRQRTHGVQDGVQDMQLSPEQPLEAQEVLSELTKVESIVNRLKRKMELDTDEPNESAQDATALYSLAREKCEALINVAIEARDLLEKRE